MSKYIYIIIEQGLIKPDGYVKTKKDVAEYTGISYSALNKSFKASGMYVGKKWTVYRIPKINHHV